MYSSQPYKIPQFVSGFNPELKVITDKQLLVDSQKYKTQEDNEIAIQSYLIMSDGLAGIFKQYTNYSFQYFPVVNMKIYNVQIQRSTMTNIQRKLSSIFYNKEPIQGTQLKQEIKLMFIEKIINLQLYRIQTINDIIMTDKIYVVYQSYIKIYTYPYGVDVGKIESLYTGINDPIRIWANALFNNYIFILSQTGDLVIGQYTNQFYKTQQIKLYSIDIDISIITKDKIIIFIKIKLQLLCFPILNNRWIDNQAILIRFTWLFHE